MFKQLWARSPNRLAYTWIVLGALLQTAFAALYLSSERVVAFWDYAMYADMAIELFQAPSLTDAFASFSSSFSQNYNLLFALPAQISFAFFGPSRFVFILTQVALVFFLYQAAIALVLSRLFARPFLSAAAITVGLTTLIPFVWFPLLQGYPDHSAATCLLFALAILIKPDRSTKENVGAGLLLAFAIIFRRHYAYAALMLLVAGGITDIRRLDLGRAIRFYVWIGLAALGGLFLIEPAYVQEMMRTNFQALYQSYNRGAAYFALFTVSRIGLDLVLLAAAGCLLAWKQKRIAAAPLLLCLGFVVGWAVLWAAAPAQAADHYMIAVLPVLIYIGLFGLALGLKNKKLRAILLLLLVSKSSYALWFASAGPLPSDPPKLSLQFTARPPWRRMDGEDLIALAQKLSYIAGPMDRIAIVGSSFALNQDLIRAVYTEVLNDSVTPLKFVPAPETDGPGQTPLDAFASATIYVVPQAPQYHLAPSGQRVVTALWSSLMKLQDRLGLFEQLPKKYKLLNTTVEVWRRRPWSPADLLQGIELINKNMSFKRQWVATQMGGGVQILQNDDRAFALANVGGASNPASLFFANPLAAGGYLVEAETRTGTNCGPVYVRARINAASGKQLGEHIVTTPQRGEQLFIPLKVLGADDFISLDLWHAKPTPCLVQIVNLRVVRQEQ